jgi:hypothetical protein
MGKGYESKSPELEYEIYSVFYGKLQARTFFNALTSEKGIPSASFLEAKIDPKNLSDKELDKSGASLRGNTSSSNDDYKFGLKSG